jgi:hypothetical protein
LSGTVNNTSAPLSLTSMTATIHSQATELCLSVSPLPVHASRSSISVSLTYSICLCLSGSWSYQRTSSPYYTGCSEILSNTLEVVSFTKNRGDRTRVTSFKHKNFTCALQQKHTFHVPGAESPNSCTNATLRCFRDSRTFYSKQERRTAFCHRTFSSCL